MSDLLFQILQIFGALVVIVAAGLVPGLLVELIRRISPKTANWQPHWKKGKTDA